MIFSKALLEKKIVEKRKGDGADTDRQGREQLNK